MNFRELAMREDLRVDLRNGPRMAAAASAGLDTVFRTNEAVRKVMQSAIESPIGPHRFVSVGFGLLVTHQPGSAALEIMGVGILRAVDRMCRCS